ncbi:hypothetical protein EN821_33850, partial [Mesorhizobium sp. M2D.F.Ca.ET.178.01.1.1]
ALVDAGLARDRLADREVQPEAATAADALDESAAPKPSALGEIDIEKAAEKLIASGAARAIFVSPEGDEAAASAVLVAREVSGNSRPMSPSAGGRLSRCWGCCG